MTDKKDDVSLKDVFDVVEDNLLPKGTRIFDTTKSKRGQQVYPKPYKIVKDIREEMGFEIDDGEDEAPAAADE